MSGEGALGTLFALLTQLGTCTAQNVPRSTNTNGVVGADQSTSVDHAEQKNVAIIVPATRVERRQLCML